MEGEVRGGVADEMLIVFRIVPAIEREGSLSQGAMHVPHLWPIGSLGHDDDVFLEHRLQRGGA